MNIENKRQFATILLAVGLGLLAIILMGKVVEDRIEKERKLFAKEQQGRSANLAKDVDALKAELQKASQARAALEKKIAQRPAIQQVAPTKEKPAVQKTAFSLRTPPGKRALTMRINSLSAVGGLVNPGDFVDIIAKLDLPGEGKKKSKKEEVITVLFQNIQVLAVGTNYDPVGDIPPYELQQNAASLNVTFAVDPEEAGLLSFAQSNGELQLSLRSAAETQDRILQEVASWDALAEFVLERQGTELRLPNREVEKAAPTEDIDDVEDRPFIQIFRGGREL